MKGYIFKYDPKQDVVRYLCIVIEKKEIEKTSNFT